MNKFIIINDKIFNLKYLKALETLEIGYNENARTVVQASFLGRDYINLPLEEGEKLIQALSPTLKLSGECKQFDDGEYVAWGVFYNPQEHDDDDEDAREAIVLEKEHELDKTFFVAKNGIFKLSRISQMYEARCASTNEKIFTVALVGGGHISISQEEAANLIKHLRPVFLSKAEWSNKWTNQQEEEK